MTAAPPERNGTRTLATLHEFARDAHSQNGEDGILHEILTRLGAFERPRNEPLWCVEFGAWDGIHLSNSRSLIETHNAHAVLIEPSDERYEELKRNCIGFPGITTIHSTVDTHGPARLDALLKDTDCPHSFDLLSIDIDGHDYWVWDAVRAYTPTVVIAEYNPTIPYEFIQFMPPDERCMNGSSLGEMRDLGRKKGYTLVAATETNCIFVRDDRFPELGLAEESLTTRALTKGLTDYRTFLYATPQGELRLAGNRVLMWHGVVLDEEAMQPLPRFLRRHHDGLRGIRKWILDRIVCRSASKNAARIKAHNELYTSAVARLRRLQKDDTP